MFLGLGLTVMHFGGTGTSSGWANSDTFEQGDSTTIYTSSIDQGDSTTTYVDSFEQGDST